MQFVVVMRCDKLRMHVFVAQTYLPAHIPKELSPYRLFLMTFKRKTSTCH